MTAAQFLVRFASILAALVPLVLTHGAKAPSAAQGISVDQYRRMFPPAPTNVGVTLHEGAAIITWAPPPPPPAGRIGYDPEVAAYNVYLVNESSERHLLGRTTKTTFKDTVTLSPGDVRHYAVTAVQRSGVESGMSEQAVLRVPGG